MPAALTIAGSDSGAGAGIQADLKTFAAHGVYGTSAITALTAQNTLGVSGIHLVSDDFVTAQIEAVAGDIGCDAVKTGMLATAHIVEAVAAAVESFDLPNLVVDPVMVAKSGDHLLDEEAVHAVRTLGPLLQHHVAHRDVHRPGLGDLERRLASGLFEQQHELLAAVTGA